MEKLSQIDLGSTLLSLAVILGFFGFVILIIRSIEIPIRIYLDRRRKNNSDSTDKVSSEPDNGFQK